MIAYRWAGQRVHAERVVAAVDDRPDVAGAEAVGVIVSWMASVMRLRVVLRLHPVDARGVQETADVRVQPEAGGPFFVS
jgi:hypothetical protein